MRQSLSNAHDAEQIRQRILQISEGTARKWGTMTSAQMLCHCDRILQVGLGKTVLPKTNLLFKFIGICTKHEMKIFGNGIPPNMPTFKVVTSKEYCIFERSKEDFFKTFDAFLVELEADNLLRNHVLFGKMSNHDWGFLQYKHINHHLKQFGV